MFKLRRKRNEKLTIHAETSSSTLNSWIEEKIADIAPSKYKSHKRRISRADLVDIDEPVIMNPNVQGPAGKKVYRYTGFPEPFNNERNTTLPHPDADTSGNFVIEAPQSNIERMHSRRSFRYGGRSHGAENHLLRHPLNRSKNSAGATGIGSDLSRLYDNIQYADGSKETRDSGVIERDVESREDLVSLSDEDKKRERLPNDSGVDMNLGISGDKENLDGYETGEKKRKGVFGKLGL